MSKLSWKPPFTIQITHGPSWDKPRCQHFCRTIIKSQRKLSDADIQALRGLRLIPDGMSFRKISESVELFQQPMTDDSGKVIAEQGTRTFEIHVQVWESFYDSGD